MSPLYLRNCTAALLAMTLLAACHRDGQRSEETAGTRVTPAEVMQPAFVNVADEQLGAAAGENWLSYGGGFANQRYSTLDQVTRSNIGDLGLAWIYQTGITESFETTPLVAGTVMFLTTPESHVVALNAASGDKLWEFVPHLHRTALCCGPNNRGVAAYGDKLFVGTIDAHLIALDQRTGRVLWDSVVADTAEPSSITMAPLAFDGRVFVGVAGGEFGIRGRVLAFDTETGREVWRFNTVPAPGEAGQPNGWFGRWKETDPFGTPLNRDIPYERRVLAEATGESWKHGGGGVYTTPAYDPATATLFFCVGNPSPDLNGLDRPGDNLFTGSIVALDGRTGQLRWYFQEVPHDVWDLSPASPPILYEARGHRYLAQAGKTGWLYVLDAASGKPVLRSDNFVPQENLFAQPTEAGVRMLPGANGGAGPAPGAYSPRTSLAYVQAVHQPMAYQRAPAPFEPGSLWLGGSFRYLPNEPQWGVVSAIDPASGTIRWQRQTPLPNLNGLLATAGDLLFAGEADGTFDAFDARTGDVVWQYPTGAGVSGGPMTYSIGGVQYIAVASGGNTQLDTRRGDNLYVFALRSKIPARGVGSYPQPRYARGGAVGAPRPAPAAPAPPATAPSAPTAQPAGVPGQNGAQAAPAGRQPARTAPAAGSQAVPPTATPGAPAATTSPGAAPAAGAARPRRPGGPRILGRPVPGPTKSPRDSTH
jgi:PQQ-dependent dehydrogenase (methanol/ethanol family)